MIVIVVVVIIIIIITVTFSISIDPCRNPNFLLTIAQRVHGYNYVARMIYEPTENFCFISSEHLHHGTPICA